MTELKVGIIGAPGRMAQRIAAVCDEAPGVTLGFALARPGSSAVGRSMREVEGFPALDLKITDSFEGGADVVIDFSGPAATARHVVACAEAKIPVVIGTTGLSEEEEGIINEAAKSCAVLTASNTSLGVNILEGLVEKLASTLGTDYDIEVVESHHRFKKDAPSGTALFLANAAARGLGHEDVSACAQHGREGRESLRKVGEIGIHALRMGDVVGEHRVFFSTLGERIEVGHVASSRDTFARGALRAAQYLAKQGPGRYTMKDVLGL